LPFHQQSKAYILLVFASETSIMFAYSLEGGSAVGQDKLAARSVEASKQASKQANGEKESQASA